MDSVGPASVRVYDLPTVDVDRTPGVLQGHAQGEIDDEGELGAGAHAGGRSADAQAIALPGPAPLSGANGPTPSIAAGAVLRSFPGETATGWIPPDPVIAVGPKYIVEVVNSGLTIYTKDGGLERAYNYLESGFFNPLLPFLPTTWSYTNGKVFDPRVLYDPWHDQYVLLALASDSVAQRSYVFVAISQTDNPLGAWWLWAFWDGNNPDTWIDYSGMSADLWGIYFTGNEIKWTGGFKHSIIQSIRPTIFSNSGSNGWIFWALTWNETGNPLARELQPAVPYTQAGDEGTFFVNTYNSSGDKACIWELTGDRGNSPTLIRNSASVGAYSSPPLARQPGAVLDDIEPFYAGALTAAYSNRKLYFSLNTDDSSNSGFYVSKVDVDTRNQDRIINLYTSGADYYYPAVGLTGSSLSTNPLVGMPMSYSSNSIYASGAFKLFTNFTVDTSGPFFATASGSATYNSYYLGRNRWGDYMGIAHDWSCYTLWSVTEYASSLNNWSTWINEVAGNTTLTGNCNLIFDDGFERGSTANWSGHAP